MIGASTTVIHIPPAEDTLGATNQADAAPGAQAPFPSPSQDNIAIEVETETGAAQEFRDLLMEVAQHVTDHNVHQLIEALHGLGIAHADDLKGLMSTAQTRDAARTIAAGLFVYAGSFGIASGVVSPLVAGASAIAAHFAPGAAFGYAAFSNLTMQRAAARGGLAARYNPLPPPDDTRVSFSGRKGAAQISDLPFDKFGTMFGLSTTFTAAAADQVGKTWGPAGIRATAGAVAAAWASRDMRAAAEGAETHAARRASPESGGYLKPQKWLDADNLGSTQQAVKDLQQCSPRAVVGYGLDALKALRFVPSELATKVINPRTYANMLALSPAGALGALKPLMPTDAWKTFMQVSVDTALVLGWQFRNQLAHRLQVGGFTEARANQTALQCHQALKLWNSLACADRMERGEETHARGPVSDSSASPPSVTYENESINTSSTIRHVT